MRGGGGGLVLSVVTVRHQPLLLWRYPGILQRIVRHEDVVEDCHDNAEGAGEVEEELPSDVVNDGAGEAEEHPARLDAEEDADTHPVEEILILVKTSFCGEWNLEFGSNTTEKFEISLGFAS